MKQTIKYSIPITLMAFILLTAKEEYIFFAQGVLEWREEVKGFPFIWAMDTINSLSINVALIPLLANLILYFGSVLFLVYLISKRFTHSKVVLIFLWLAATPLCILELLWFQSNDTYFYWLFDFTGYEIKLDGYSFAFWGCIG